MQVLTAALFFPVTWVPLQRKATVSKKNFFNPFQPSCYHSQTLLTFLNFLYSWTIFSSSTWNKVNASTKFNLWKKAPVLLWEGSNFPFHCYQIIHNNFFSQNRLACHFFGRWTNTGLWAVSRVYSQSSWKASLGPVFTLCSGVPCWTRLISAPRSTNLWLAAATLACRMRYSA